MKKLILLIILSRISSCMLAQDIDSLIEIKGYYVTRYLKKEIVFYYEQQIKEERGESYEMLVDYDRYSVFVPIQVGEKIVCETDSITKAFLDFKSYDSVYVSLNNRLNNNFLKKMNIITTDISKEVCIISNFERFSPYYEYEIDNSNTLFKCMYIEGYAVHKHIQEIEKKWQYHFYRYFNKDKQNENVEFFFIVKINNYTPYIELPRLKKWLPY